MGSNSRIKCPLSNWERALSQSERLWIIQFIVPIIQFIVWILQFIVPILQFIDPTLQFIDPILQFILHSPDYSIHSPIPLVHSPNPFLSAWSKSSLRSWTLSTPMDSLTKLSVMPNSSRVALGIALCVISALEIQKVIVIEDIDSTGTHVLQRNRY